MSDFAIDPERRTEVVAEIAAAEEGVVGSSEEGQPFLYPPNQSEADRVKLGIDVETWYSE